MDAFTKDKNALRKMISERSLASVLEIIKTSPPRCRSDEKVHSRFAPSLAVSAIRKARITTEELSLTDRLI